MSKTNTTGTSATMSTWPLHDWSRHAAGAFELIAISSPDPSIDRKFNHQVSKDGDDMRRVPETLAKESCPVDLDASDL